MGNGDTHISQRWSNDIHEFLFSDIGLDVNQSNRYGYTFLQSEPSHNPFDNEQLKQIGFINFTKRYSHMLYWKSGHSLVNQIFDGLYHELFDFTKTRNAINDTIVIPYKDPVEKFLSAYFTSNAFQGRSGKTSTEIHKATRQVTHNDIEQLTERCYNSLDTFVDKCLSNGDATGMGKNTLSPHYLEDILDHPEPKVLFDMHFYPVHLLLYQALRNTTTPFKLLGLNLDHDTEQFLYSDIIESKEIPLQRKDMLLHRQSANNNFIKIVCQKWKCANLSKVDQLVQMFLLNDYKLIEVLDKNSIIELRTR